ncbi:MAG: alpha/beta fold hydrolase [Deltaproteobacteria bacterium]|nr:alpha/beta fold hydrolase [Deltaproteobacteria bacterium]
MRSATSLWLVLCCCGEGGPSGADHADPSDAGASDAGAPDARAPDAAAVGDASIVELDAGLREPAWAACDTADWPTGYPRPPADTWCTTISVPLDRAHPEGPAIDLRVARQGAGPTRSASAVFVIEGGPGGSSVFTSGLIPGAMRGLSAELDVVYVDLRGTGGSGYLGCPGRARSRAELIACAAAQSGVDLNRYLSRDAADDLEAVRSRLGYSEISLFAVSYGTRIAFEYLRRHSDRVTAAILDGVAPPSADLFSDTIGALQRGIDLLVADCERDPACLLVSPALRADLDARRQVLRRSPRPVLVNGQPASETEGDYLAFLKAFLSQAESRFLVPRAIHAANLGDNSPWNALMSAILGAPVRDGAGTARAPGGSSLSSLIPEGRLGASFGSPVVNMANLCAEILPNSPGVDALNLLGAQEEWLTGNILEKANACASWEVLALGPEDREPLRSSARILLLSGAIDLNVDPRWASEARSTLSNAVEVVVPYATHLTTYVPCVGAINVAYLRSGGDLARVDRSCLDSLPAPDWN